MGEGPGRPPKKRTARRAQILSPPLPPTPADAPAAPPLEASNALVIRFMTITAGEARWDERGLAVRGAIVISTSLCGIPGALSVTIAAANVRPDNEVRFDGEEMRRARVVCVTDCATLEVCASAVLHRAIELISRDHAFVKVSAQCLFANTTVLASGQSIFQILSMSAIAPAHLTLWTTDRAVFDGGGCTFKYVEAQAFGTSHISSLTAMQFACTQALGAYVLILPYQPPKFNPSSSC